MKLVLIAFKKKKNIWSLLFLKKKAIRGKGKLLFTFCDGNDVDIHLLFAFLILSLWLLLLFFSDEYLQYFTS